MYKQFIKKILASSAVIAACCGLSFPASAAKIDLEKNIVINSKRQAGDLKNKIASYLDDVVITQGSLTIKADIVQIFKKNENQTYVAKGQPAYFEQLLDDGSKIVMEADEVKYEPALYIITISGNAVLKQAGSEVKGERITYNTQTEQLNAESGDNADESVTTILKPQAKDKN